MQRLFRSDQRLGHSTEILRVRCENKAACLSCLHGEIHVDHIRMVSGGGDSPDQSRISERCLSANDAGVQ